MSECGRQAEPSRLLFMESPPRSSLAAAAGDGGPDGHDDAMVVWLSGCLGHVMIVASAPRADPVVRGAGGQWLVRVIDSSESAHTNDTRTSSGDDGLGTGRSPSPPLTVAACLPA